MSNNTTNDDGNSSTHQRCQRCRKHLPLSTFPLVQYGSRQGQITKTCLPCSLIKDLWRAKKNGSKEKENVPATAAPETRDDDTNDFIGVTEISLNTFASFIGKQSGHMKISARVNLSDLVVGEAGMKEKADKLAERVWDETNYRFMYVIIIIVIL